MLSLSDPAWKSLHHAYGSAETLPALLEAARASLTPGHKPGPWFDLWSALCHQGDAYTASYAALPHLVDIAHDRRGIDAQFDPLFLVSCIELSRMEGMGPELTDNLAPSYILAIQKALFLVDEALVRPWEPEYLEALEAGRLALVGDHRNARHRLEAE